jgi:hypothetical protein
LMEASESVGPGADDDRLLEEVNRRIGQVVGGFNRLPRSDMAGLSPEQASALLRDDWSGEGTIRLNRSLSLSRVEASDLLANARTLLAAADPDGLPATQSGNLGVAAVRSLLDRLRPPELIARSRRYSKRSWEQDFWPLHEARVLLELSGLLARRKGRFRLTRAGRTMLPETSAGELFARLFTTHLRKYNLEYGSRGPEWPGLQSTISFTLYALSREAGSWASSVDLLPRVLLPAVMDELPESDPATLALWMELRILTPLCDYALLEESPGPPGSGSRAGRDIRYRLAPLFGEFLSFHLDGGSR